MEYNKRLVEFFEAMAASGPVSPETREKVVAAIMPDVYGPLPLKENRDGVDID